MLKHSAKASWRVTYISKHKLLAIIHVVYHSDPLTDPHVLLWVFDQQKFLCKEETKKQKTNVYVLI